MNASDLTRHGLEPGDEVGASDRSAWPQSHRRLRLTAIAYDVPYFEANDLCPLDYQDKQSGTPSWASIPVVIQRAKQTGGVEHPPAYRFQRRPRSPALSASTGARRPWVWTQGFSSAAAFAPTFLSSAEMRFQTGLR